MFLHGLQEAGTGIYEIVTQKQHKSPVQMGAEKLARSAGAGRETAETVGIATDIGTGIALGFAGARSAAMRAAEREAAEFASLVVPKSGINPDLLARRDAYVAWKARRGITGRSATLQEFEAFRGGNAGLNGGQFYARKSGFGGRVLARARQLGVDLAWADELALVRRGGSTREWSAFERIELETTGRVKGYYGHHVNSAARYPHLASSPANVRFVTWDEHFQLHGGNWLNPTTGPLIPR